MGRSTAPISAPPTGPVLMPAKRASAGDSAKGRVRANTFCSVRANDAELSGRLSRRGRGSRRATARARVASAISSMGVMPAMGSREKLPSEYETAPTSRPSMKTGLPLIPAITPVVASGPPSSRARIRLRCGPITFSRTPRTWTLNSSTACR